MKIDVITLFPKMFESPFAEGMIKRAVDKNIVKIECHDMRQWAWNSYGAVDDKPYGGDIGMLVRVDVIDKAISEMRSKSKGKVILTSARGKRFDQETARRWSKEDRLIFVCGRYEGVDQRVADNLIDEEISIGDYILTGGELPTMVMIDSVTRLIPGVLGKNESVEIESFSKPNWIEHPQYTRPAEYNGMVVPEVLLSGDPKKIKAWQLEQSRSSDDDGKQSKN